MQILWITEAIPYSKLHVRLDPLVFTTLHSLGEVYIQYNLRRCKSMSTIPWVVEAIGVCWMYLPCCSFHSVVGDKSYNQGDQNRSKLTTSSPTLSNRRYNSL